MSSFLYNVRYLQAGLEVLENFLLSGDVYWPIGVSAPAGETPYPQLSLGGLALAKTRCQASAHSVSDQNQLARAVEQIEELHQHWRTAWINKATNELHGRLNQWGNFLDEYRESPQSNYDRYAYEVFRRVIIQLLIAQNAELSKSDSEILAGLDSILKASIKTAPFVWDLDYQGAFPKDTYWYLYGRLPKVKEPTP